MLRAAAWITTSLAPTSGSTTAGSHTVPFTNSKPEPGRFSRRPVNRSSSTVTRAPSRSRRRTRLLPTKPAPPVTSTRRPASAAIPAGAGAFSSAGLDDTGPPGGSALEAEPEQDEGSQDAPAVAQRAHLRGAPRMIAHGHRRLPHAVTAAQGLEEQVGLELVAVGPVLVEADAGVVEQREPERAHPVGAVGAREAARQPHEHRVEPREPAGRGRDAGGGP